MGNYFINVGLGVVKVFMPSFRPIIAEIGHFLLPRFLRRSPESFAIAPFAYIAYIHWEIFAITWFLLLMP